MKQPASNRPNVLLITSDQQHHSTLGTVNPRIQTPALDRLVREGIRFDRAYCPNPTCTPTRASIITGMYPSQHGAWSLGTKLFEDVPAVSEMLTRHGYQTSLIGKAHFQPLATAPGMDSIECQPRLRDLDFWREFHGPWYGFSHVETARMHADESHAGQHYALWLEEQGLQNWRDYFEPWPPDAAAPRPYKSGRTWMLPEHLHYSVWTAERTIARMEAAAEASTPFFIWASFHDPHPPYLAPEPWASMYDPNAMQPGTLEPGEHARNPIHFGMTQQIDPDYSVLFPPEDGVIHGAHSHLMDEPTLRANMAVYYGMVSLMDREIGRILNALDNLGLTDNTLVVFTTDHGSFLGQHGLAYKAIHHYEDLLRIPFIVRWPGHAPAGRISSAIQNLVDLAPTFLHASGASIPGVMTGVSQLDTWRGGAPARRWSITENHHGTTYCHLRTYVDQRYKLTVYRHGDDGELFDLEADPDERHNLWHEPTAAVLKSRLMHAFLQATLACEPMRMPRIAGA